MSLKTKFDQWKNGNFFPSNIEGYEEGQDTLGGLGIVRDGVWVQPKVVMLTKSFLEFIKKNWDKIILSVCAIITAAVTINAMKSSEPKKDSIPPSTVNEQHTDKKTVEPSKDNHQNIIPSHNAPKPKENIT